MTKKSIIAILLLAAIVFTLSPAPKNSGINALTLGSRILKYGSKGTDVKSLQYHLKQLGYYKYNTSGYFNSQTKAAVQNFQKRNKLKLTGIVDKITLDKIKIMYKRRFSFVPGVAAFKAKKKITLGYTTVDYYNDKNSHNSVNSYSQFIDSISTFSHLIDAKGNLIGDAPKNTLNIAKERKIAPFMLIHNYRNGFDRKLARDFLKNPQARKNLINKVLSTMKTNGYIGVNIDIENVYPSDRKYYTAFIKEISASLHSRGYLVIASIPAKVKDITNDGWSGGFDYQEIGKVVDFTQIMTYDEHWFGGKPGPIASLPWVSNVVKYTTSTIPKEKVLLGIAAYGYDWSPSKTKVVQLKNVNNLVNKYGGSLEWNDKYQVPFYKYNDGTTEREVWLENETSIKYKLDLVNNYGLRGIAIWRLGYETENFWKAIDENI